MITQYEPTINYNDINKMMSSYLKTKGWLTEYKYTEELEKSIASFLNVKHCIITNNGTISLSLALLAYGIKPGDRVLIPDLTMIATAYAVELIGAKPIFCDIESETLCMDLRYAKVIIESRMNSDSPIDAVIHVSLNGRRNNWLAYEDFKNFLSYHGIPLLEDNAQAFGSKQSCEYISCPKEGIGSFSFSMPKIITTGQGGCLVTNEDNLALRLRKLKDFGRVKGGVDIHDDFGINGKFTEIQAIVGLSQMKDIQKRIVAKKSIYNEYYKRLCIIKNINFLNTSSECTPWFVDIYVPSREQLIDYLNKQGIKTRPIYPAVHTQKNYKKINGQFDKDFQEASRMSTVGLWLPSSMNLKTTDIAKICDYIIDFYRQKQSNDV